MDRTIVVSVPVLLLLGAALFLLPILVLYRERRRQASATLARHSTALDIPRRSRAGAFRESQREVLRMIVSGAALPDVLQRICSLVEAFDAELKCSITLIDTDRWCLGTVTAPSLPVSFTSVMEGTVAGSAGGSCAAAVARAELVITEDIATDPLWTHRRDLALAHKLRSCWSSPVLGGSGQLVATFAIYYPKPRRPSQRELDLVHATTGLVSVAIEHARAETQLRESWSRLELAQRVARLGYWERDLVKKRTVAFGDANAMLGLDAGETIDLNTLVERVVPEDRHILVAGYQEVRDNTQLSPMEFRVRQRDGSVRYVLAQRRGFRDDSGRITKVIGTVQDVTAQREVASHLQASEERFRLVAEHTGQLIIDCRMAEGELRCAGAIREILGEEADAVAKLPLEIWRKVVHPEDLPLVEQAMERLLRGERISVAYRLLRSDGRVLDVEATGSAIMDEQGHPTRIIATISNISDRRRAEAERQRYLAQLAFLADAARKVNSVLSVAELLQIITDIARDLVGAHVAISAVLPDEGWRDGLHSISASEKYAALAGETLVTPALRNSAGELADGLRMAGPRATRRSRATMTDDEQQDLTAILDAAGVVTVPLVTPDGRANGLIRVADKREGDFSPNDERVLGQLADLAAVGIENARLYGELEARVLKRTQELEHSNRELEAFSYSVSHDLRGPLRAIAGFTGLLRERHYDSIDADSRRYLDRIEAGTQRMSGLIDDLLELGRVTRVEIRRESVNLSSLAEAVLNRIRERTPERVAQFTIEPDHNVEGDLRLLEIVLENLLDNAWKFTASRERADIRFGGRAVGAERVFFVRDNGVGFDPRYASNLFGVFQRLHAAADFPGTGVGLATVQRIVQRHGGRIWAEAEVDRGAAFYFTIAEEQQ